MNILPKITWLKLSRPQLTKSSFYLELVDQGLIEPLGIYKYVEITIMGISARVDFEVIEPKLGSNSYLALVSFNWERNMKENISLEKDKLRLREVVRRS